MRGVDRAVLIVAVLLGLGELWQRPQLDVYIHAIRHSTTDIAGVFVPARCANSPSPHGSTSGESLDVIGLALIVRGRVID